MNNAKTEFIVVNQGKPSSLYDDSCDGTWLLMRSNYGSRYFSDASDNVYETSYIHSYLNNTFLNQLDIKDIVKQVKIPYRSGGGVHGTDQSGANGLSTKVFLLSGYEVGWTTSDSSDFPVDGAKLSYFTSGTGAYANKMRIMYSGLIASEWWTRSPQTTNSFIMWIVNEDGSYYRGEYNQSLSVRPAFIIPSDTYIDEDNNIRGPYNAISTLNVGDSVFCKEDGVDTEYLLVHKGNPDTPMYDASCNGAWLLRKDVYENRQWNSPNNNSYGASTIHGYLNGTFLNLLDIKDIVRQAKIPYVNGTGGSAVASGANGLSAKVFLLSGYEVGWTTSDSSYFPVDGAKLDYFTASTGGNPKRIANFNGSAANWWLRSPFNDGTGSVWCVDSDGNGVAGGVDTLNGIRPAFIVPLDTQIDLSNNIIA